MELLISGLCILKYPWLKTNIRIKISPKFKIEKAYIHIFSECKRLCFFQNSFPDWKLKSKVKLRSYTCTMLWAATMYCKSLQPGNDCYHKMHHKSKKNC